MRYSFSFIYRPTVHSDLLCEGLPVFSLTRVWPCSPCATATPRANCNVVSSCSTMCKHRTKNANTALQSKHDASNPKRKSIICLLYERKMLLHPQTLQKEKQSRKTTLLCGFLSLLVRAKGLEPSWSCLHTDLNRTRLPIPPRPRIKHTKKPLDAYERISQILLNRK